jgi:oxidoreductase AflX
MPKYALLGATGGTGGAILRSLIRQPPADLSLKILVRNKSKLAKMFPSIASASPPFPVEIIEGTPGNSTALQQTLEDVDAIFQCIASNDAAPGVRLCQDTVDQIISALEEIRKRKGQEYKTPTTILLRSHSVNQHYLKHHANWLLVSIIKFILYHSYEDLERATEKLERASSSGPSSPNPSLPPLLHHIHIDPGALHDPDGVEPTGHELLITEKPAPEINYADLGAAMVEVAERREQFRGVAVMPSATGQVRETWHLLRGFLLRGLYGRIFGR